MKHTVLPEAPEVLNPGATIIQQLELHTGQGLQRLCMLLLHILDPQSHGVVITPSDIESFTKVLESGRVNLGVVGMGDTGFMVKLVDHEEGKRFAERSFKPEAP